MKTRIAISLATLAVVATTTGCPAGVVEKRPSPPRIEVPRDPCAGLAHEVAVAPVEETRVTFTLSELFPAAVPRDPVDLGTIQIVPASQERPPTLPSLDIAHLMPRLDDSLSKAVRPHWDAWRASRQELFALSSHGDEPIARGCFERARDRSRLAQSALREALRASAAPAEIVLLVKLTESLNDMGEPNPAMAEPRRALERLVQKEEPHTTVGWWARYVLAGVMVDHGKESEARTLLSALIAAPPPSANARADARFRLAELETEPGEQVRLFAESAAEASEPPLAVGATYRRMVVAYDAQLFTELLAAARRLATTSPIVADVRPEVGIALAQALSYLPDARTSSLEMTPSLVAATALALAEAAEARRDLELASHALQIAADRADPQLTSRIESIRARLAATGSENLRDRATAWLLSCATVVTSPVTLTVSADGRAVEAAGPEDLVTCLRREAPAHLRGAPQLRMRFQTR